MTKLSPRISIITPSFNQGEFIQETLSSVLEQKDIDLEYIVLDSKSSDNTVKILKKFKKKYPTKLYWRSQKDKGQVDAINKGIKISKGDIIAFLNSDDLYTKNALSTVINYFDTNPDCLWLVGNCTTNSLILSWTFSLRNKIPINKFPFLLYIFNWISQPSVFLSSKIVKKVGLFDTRYSYAFDYDYWLRCLGIKAPHKINKTLSLFRIHEHSKGSRHTFSQFHEDLAILSKYCSNRIYTGAHRLLSTFVVMIYLATKSKKLRT